MNKYESMFIVKPDLPEEERKTLFNQIGDVIVKNKGSVSSASIWTEKKRLFFPLKKCLEGMYYLVTFTLEPSAVKELGQAYKLNENILRFLITKSE